MINLLPTEYKEEISYGRKNHRTLTWVATVGFGILALLIAAYVGKVTIESAKGQAISQKTIIEDQMRESKLDDTEKQYASFVDGTSSVKKIYSQEILYSRLIRKLATLLPPDSKITNISLTDKDRAINLNFNNSKDGLGPVILVNLLSQGQQIADKTRLITVSAFRIQMGGKSERLSSELLQPIIAVDTKAKAFEYFVNITDGKLLDKYTRALKNGGEFSYQIVSQDLVTAGFAAGYDTSKKVFMPIPDQSSKLPQLTSYTINNDQKYVDYHVRASDLTALRNIENILTTLPNSTYIETYLFEDRDAVRPTLCNDGVSAGTTCKVVCANGSTACAADEKHCQATIPNGCAYIIRAYYDELFSSASISPVNDSEKKACSQSASTNYLPCTHKVTAQYSQLFDKVDINKTSACSTETSGVQKCPVDIRAQFSPEAKFYFINSKGATR